MAPSCKSPMLSTAPSEFRAAYIDSIAGNAEWIIDRQLAGGIALHLAIQPIGDLLIFPGELNPIAVLGSLGAVHEFGEAVLVALGFEEDIVGDEVAGEFGDGKEEGSEQRARVGGKLGNARGVVSGDARRGGVVAGSVEIEI